MLPSEFEKRTAGLGMSGRAVEAARLVLVYGLGVRVAARDAGLSGPGAVSRAVARIRAARICPCCGQVTRVG